MTLSKPEAIAVWAITDRAAALAQRIVAGFGTATRFVPLAAAAEGAQGFSRLRPAVASAFHRFSGHVFVMAAGIVVRIIAPLLHGKTEDPAVVVVDEAGRWAVSLVSGHIGGANRLAERVAAICGAEPVITTATDVRGVPALDALAAERGLAIENPAAIKAVSMALLNGDSVWWHDPGNWLTDLVPERWRRPMAFDSAGRPLAADGVGVFVAEARLDLPAPILVLRPASLVAGVGCNRGTDAGEILDLLASVLEARRLSPMSLASLATIDLKRNEPGLTAAAAALNVPICYFSAEALARASGTGPSSAVVFRHVGVGNVCEAAAILAAAPGSLMIPKHKSANATVAIARRVSTSSASVREESSISPNAPGLF